MNTPNALPALKDAMVHLVTNDVKIFVEKLSNMQERRPHLQARPQIQSQLENEVDEFKNMADAALNLLAVGELLDDFQEQLEPVRCLDSWLRSVIFASASHWFAILIERFVGDGYVGPRFEHRGIHYIFHDRRDRPLFLVTGSVSVKAAYYRPEGGGQGIFPIDLVLGVDASGCTREGAFLMAHFSAETDYTQAEELIERATGLRLDKNRLHRQIASLGDTAQKVQQQVSEDEDAPVPVARMVIETDGLMTPMRFDPEGEKPEKAKAGYHEAHVGVVGIPGPAERPKPKYRRKDRSPDRRVKTRADHHSDVKLGETSYVATYEGRQGHLDKLRVEAERRGWTEKTQTALIGDGADWVHEKSDSLFPGAVHILDWYHAVEHLAKVRDLAYEIGSSAGEAWFARHETNLWDGQISVVIRSISYLARTSRGRHARALRTESAYFRNRVWMLDYPAYRDAGWPIGSGAVESACRHVVQERCKCSGMRWSPQGLRRLLAVRTTIINNRYNRFQELWSIHTRKRSA